MNSVFRNEKRQVTAESEIMINDLNKFTGHVDGVNDHTDFNDHRIFHFPRPAQITYMNGDC